MTDLSFITNVITSLFCAAVLVQTVRLSRAVHKLRHAGLIEVVASLEAATDTSQQALGELTKVLSAAGPPLEAAVRGARDLRAQLVTLRDELSLMIDIGNGVAERILAAANGARDLPRGAGDVDMTAADDTIQPGSPTAVGPSREGRDDAITAPSALPPPPTAARRRAGPNDGGGRGGAFAVIDSSDTSSSAGQRDLPPQAKLDRADAPASAAAKESQS